MRLGIVVSVLVVLAAGFAFTFAYAQNQNAAPPPNLERGRAVAVGAVARDASGACFRCHGLDGKGDGTAVFPRLADQAQDYLYRSLKEFASGARQNPIMAPIAHTLSDADMRAVAAYYAAQKSNDYGPKPTVDAQTLQTGAVIAAIGSAERGVQSCTNCHGPVGTGLAPTYPYLAGQYANYLEQQLHAFKDGKRQGSELASIMSGIAKQMTDNQMHAVSLYYGSIRPEAMISEQAAAKAPAAAGSASGAQSTGR